MTEPEPTPASPPWVDFIGTPDPRQLQVHRPPGPRDVPYVPTDPAVVEAMLDLAAVTPDDVVYDLGCGDGRIAIAAAKRGARAVGVDIDLQRVRESYDNVRAAGLRSRVSIVRASLFDVDLRDATVVTLYLLPGVNVRLRPKLLFELRAGARVVSNNFDSEGWQSVARVPFQHRTLFKWVVPAWVAGDWRCVVDAPGGREHLWLSLARRLQTFEGRVKVGRREWPLVGGAIDGERVAFTLHHPLYYRPPRRFTGRVVGATVRGTCETIGERTCPWGATLVSRADHGKG